MSASAPALDPAKTVDQYVRTRWTTEDGLPQNSITDIVQTSDGYIWVATSGGLARFDGVRFTTFDVAAHPELGSNLLTALYEDRLRNLWIGSSDGDVAIWHDGTFAAFERQEELPDGPVKGFREDGDGALWILFADVEIRWRRDGGRLDVSPRSEPDPGAAGARWRDRDGNLWLVRGAELHRLPPGAADGAGKQLDADSMLLTTHSSILSLLEDREGNLWIGTRRDGLLSLHDGAFTSYSAVHGFTDRGVYSIVETTDGEIWLATFGDGFFRFRNGDFTRVPLPDGFAEGGALLSDRDGRIWLGAEGLVRWDDGRLAAFFPKDSLPGNGIVYALYQDLHDTIWVGFQNGGLGALDDDELILYTTRDGLVDDHVRFITEDRQGALWIGTYRGMSRFYEGRFTSYTTADGLPFDYVRAIHEDPAGVLWIGTFGGGLARFAQGRVTHLFSTRNGLHENTVSRILVDDDGDFWLSGNRGITRVLRGVLESCVRGETDSVVATLYGEADGMSVSETYGGRQPAGWKASDGRLWFPTVRGVAVVDPSRLHPEDPPPLHIERVLVDQEERSLDSPILAFPGQTGLEVHYTALQYAFPREVRFRHRLVGFEDDWVEVGNRREAYYTHLHPSEYTFKVEAAAYAGGEWSPPQSLQVVFRPYIWETLWFKALVVLGLVAGGYQVRNLRSRARNRALQAETERLKRAIADKDRIFVEILRAESPAHLAALRDELRKMEQSDEHEDIFLHAEFFSDLRRMVEGLESLERLPSSEDRAYVLGQALTRALSLQERLENEERGNPALGGMALETVEEIFSSALLDVQQHAELELGLRSRHLTAHREATIVLEVKNTGRGDARDVEVDLDADEAALNVTRPRQLLGSLRRGQSAQLEFLVEPHHSERVRLSFRVTWNDFLAPGDDPGCRQERRFADVVELRRFQEPAIFRPLRPNPYVVGRPLLDTDLFYGREKLFGRVATSLEGAAQDNVVILIGQRRMGKTSILRRLHRHLPETYVPVLVDLQGLLGAGEPAFFREVTGQVVDGLEERGVRVSEPAPDDFEADPGIFFRRRFLPRARDALHGRRLLLVFDEFEVLEERIKTGALTPQILPYLRSLMQHEKGVSFLLAGTHRLDDLTADYWGVLFNLAVYLEVGHLAASDVEALLAEPTSGSFEIDSLAQEKIYWTTGGHPHFSQLLGRELVDYANQHQISYVTVQDVNRVIETVAEKGQLHIAYLWQDATRDERLLLLAAKELLEREGQATAASLHRFLTGRGVDPGDLPEAARCLQRKEILTAEAGQLSFRIDLLRRWLVRHHDLETFVLSQA